MACVPDRKNNQQQVAILESELFQIGGGAYLNYLQAQRAAESQLSDLTLANLEAMVWPTEGIDIDGDIYTGDMTDRPDCESKPGSNCGMTVSTPSGGYVEYVAGATHKPGWAS